jgi:hypothetical protein
MLLSSGSQKVLRNMSLLNPLDFLVVFELIQKLFSVLNLLSLSVGDKSDWSRGLGLPGPNVSFIRTRKNVLSVHRPQNRENLLHPFRVINLETFTLICVEQSDCLIIGARNELKSTWVEIDRQNCSNVALVNLGRHVHFSHVKLVNVSILVSSQEVERLHWVPGYAGAFIAEVSFDQFRLGSQVKLENPSVNPSADSDLEFDRVEPRLEDAVTAPLETVRALGLFDVPYLELLSGSQKPPLIDIKRD